MFSCYIKQIKIENIRNFHEITIDFNNKSTIIIGRNGIGKTSILEAISLIYPDNGIRNEKYENITNNESNQHNWKTIITVNDGDYSNIIEAIYQNKKKTIKINDKKIKNFNEILDYCRMFCVTQDDYHQILSSSIFRRRFFDRMIAQFTRDYYNQLVQYHHYIVEKNKIFASHNGYFSASQNSWLDEIDKKLAKLNWLIALNRNDFILIIQKLAIIINYNLIFTFTIAPKQTKGNCRSALHSRMSRSYISRLHNNRSH